MDVQRSGSFAAQSRFFRSVYHTLIEDWLKGDAKSVLGKSYEKLSFIRG